MYLRRLVALSATLLLLASPALAQPAPTGSPPLGMTSGLGERSNSPIGFIAPTPDNLQDYLKGMEAIQINAAYHSTQDAKVGDMRVKNGADVTITAGYTKKDGQELATLDGITLTANGVSGGPFGLIKMQKAEIHADGTMDVKLNSWIPTDHFKKPQRKSNGDVEIHGSWWSPYILIKKDGDVFLRKFHMNLRKMGTIDPEKVATLAENWPPDLDTLAELAMGAKKAKTSSTPVASSTGTSSPSGTSTSSTATPPLSPGAAKALAEVNQLAGKLTWDVKARGSGLPVTFDGAPLNATENLQVKGAAELKNGEVKTTGSGNTMHMEVDLAKDTYGDDKLGLTIASGKAVLDGTYSLDTKLADPKNSTKMKFDGTASYTGTAKDLHMTLPNGGKVAISQLDIDRTGGVHVAIDGQKYAFNLDDARYSFDAKGPMHFENIGPISEMDADGTISSKGLARISNKGLMTLQGNLKGELDVTSAGLLPVLDGKKGYYSSHVKPGSSIKLDFDQVAGALNLPMSKTDKLAFVGADARGTVGVHAVLENTDVKKDGLELKAPEAVADLKVATSVRMRGTDMSGNATVSGGIELPKGASVAIDTPKFQASTRIDPGTKVALNAKITSPAAGPSKGTTTISGKIGGHIDASDTTVHALGSIADLKDKLRIALDVPFAAKIGPDKKVTIDPVKTQAKVPVTIALLKGSKISYNGNTVTLTDDTCYVKLTGDIAVDASGKPVLKQLENVDIDLELGAATALLLGKVYTVPGLGRMHFTGGVTFSDKGMTLHGKAEGHIASQTAPIFDITF